MTPVETPPDDPTRQRLEALMLEGQNLRGLSSGPQPAAQEAFRKNYLGWHDQITHALDAAGQSPADVDQFRNTAWQLVATAQISDDELVRTVLGDIDFKVGRLDAFAHPPASRPDRAILDPTTVGVAIYDANCLFAKHTRYLLLGLAVHGVVQARWSSRLLEETAASLAGKLRGDSLEDLGRWIKTEIDLVRDGLVTGYEHWIPGLSLPDAGDNHVLAAAIESGATTIVTDNLRHFPEHIVEPYGIVAKDPDDFLLECIDANPVLAARLVTDAPDPDRLLNNLDQAVPNTAHRLRTLVS